MGGFYSLCRGGILSAFADSLLKTFFYDPKKDEWKPINRWKATIFLVVAAASISLYIDNVAAVKEKIETIEKIDRKIDIVSNQNASLRKKIAELESPERIVKIAEEKMGMRICDKKIRVLILK